MASDRKLKHVGLGAIVAYLFVPEVALVVLLGRALNWWVAGFTAAGAFALAVLFFAIARSRGVLGHAFGTAGWDPLDYAQWTRYLLVRPAVVSLPASLAAVAAAVMAAAYGASEAATAAVAVVAAVPGFALGALLWVRVERRYRAKRAVEAREE
jgi:hypothetical protein